METIYLDTHVVVWLFYGFTKRISNTAKKLINENELTISPLVILEMHYLFERKRISHTANEITETLHKKIGLKVSKNNFEDIVKKAVDLNFSSDPFDRIIVSEAELNNCKIITKDENILKNYKKAIW